jgi:hypothetical protein
MLRKLIGLAIGRLEHNKNIKSISEGYFSRADPALAVARPHSIDPLHTRANLNAKAAGARIANKWREGSRGEDSLANGDVFRRIALSFEGASEAPHFDRAAFKAPRTFATLAADEQTANIRFAPEEQEFKCLLAPDAFSPISGAWGLQGWTVAKLSALNEADLHAALESAWRRARPAKRATRKKP